jgi:hypothetical protein
MFVLLAATSLLVASSATVWAGGWAMTTLDTTPGDLRGGETYEIGYTILQHGIRPVAVDHTEIRLHGPWKVGGMHVFEGRPQGGVGHYVAEVRFPEAGEYRWEVTQGPFPNHDLGRILVGEPVPVQSSASPDMVRIVLPIVALISVAFVVWQAMAIRRLRPVIDAA